VNTIEHGLVNL